MKGVILFADNKILEANTFENKLFERLNASTEYVVFPINSVDALEETLKNVSPKSLIYDLTLCTSKLNITLWKKKSISLR